MPYIKAEKREALDRDLNRIRPETEGELNYAITVLVRRWAEDHSPLGFKYEIGNRVMGVFESAKAEFYRRCMVPYEDLKREENGDVYGELVE